MSGSSNLNLLWAEAQKTGQNPLPVQGDPAETQDMEQNAVAESVTKSQESGPVPQQARTRAESAALPKTAVPVEDTVSPVQGSELDTAQNQAPSQAPEAPTQVNDLDFESKPQETPERKPRQTPKRPPGRRADPSSQTCELRGFPKSLVRMAKQSAPDASNVKAVAAFLYAHRDPDYACDYSDVPADVIELAGQYDKAKHIRQADENIVKILSKLSQLEKNDRLERFVLTTLLMNANGLLGQHVSSGSGINYTPPDFDLVFNEMAKQAEKYWDMIIRREGRPIK